MGESITATLEQVCSLCHKYRYNRTGRHSIIMTDKFALSIIVSFLQETIPIIGLLNYNHGLHI